jgi:hypothetical protein
MVCLRVIGADAPRACSTGPGGSGRKSGALLVVPDGRQPGFLFQKRQPLLEDPQGGAHRDELAACAGGGVAVPFKLRDAGFLLGDVVPGLRDVPAGAVEGGSRSDIPKATLFLVNSGHGNARLPLARLNQMLRFPSHQRQLFPDDVQGDLHRGEQGVYWCDVVAGVFQRGEQDALRSDIPQPLFDLLADLRQDGVVGHEGRGAAWSAGGSGRWNDRADVSPTQAPAVPTAGGWTTARPVGRFPSELNCSAFDWGLQDNAFADRAHGALQLDQCPIGRFCLAVLAALDQMVDADALAVDAVVGGGQAGVGMQAPCRWSR